MMAWLTLMPIIEAAEQTVLQRAVPFERQGRVFGFAQAIESAASPVIALAIGPFAQEVTIPFMTTGSGRDLFGGLFGSGIASGIGICFTAAGLIGLAMTAAARTTRPYRQLDGATRAPATAV
jgi:DHA3 family multidrug efflux protein-like MFS transporter